VKAQGHTLVIDVERGRLACRGDPVRLAQAVANLLHNAARYTAPGGRIDLDAWRDDDQVVIRVRDNGHGIAPQLLPHVFDLFVQGRSPASRRRRRCAGLAITKNLVELHGGTVRAASDGPGTGAEFVIRLPRMTEVDAVTDWSVPAELAARGTAGASGLRRGDAAQASDL
jgi:signal transduction histidine kinase